MPPNALPNATARYLVKVSIKTIPYQEKELAAKKPKDTKIPACV
jgi:hypothetical protein